MHLLSSPPLGPSPWESVVSSSQQEGCQWFCWGYTGWNTPTPNLTHTFILHATSHTTCAIRSVSANEQHVCLVCSQERAALWFPQQSPPSGQFVLHINIQLPSDYHRVHPICFYQILFSNKGSLFILYVFISAFVCIHVSKTQHLLLIIVQLRYRATLIRKWVVWLIQTFSFAPTGVLGAHSVE